MKFEITSFVAAVVVYLVRLRLQYVGGTRPLFMPAESTSSTQPERQAGSAEVEESSSMQAGSTYSGSRYNATGFVRGCSRAV
jgi:hypothetical protein